METIFAHYEFAFEGVSFTFFEGNSFTFSVLLCYNGIESKRLKTRYKGRYKMNKNKKTISDDSDDGLNHEELCLDLEDEATICELYGISEIE